MLLCELRPPQATDAERHRPPVLVQIASERGAIDVVAVARFRRLDARLRRGWKRAPSAPIRRGALAGQDRPGRHHRGRAQAVTGDELAADLEPRGPRPHQQAWRRRAVHQQHQRRREPRGDQMCGGAGTLRRDLDVEVRRPTVDRPRRPAGLDESGSGAVRFGQERMAEAGHHRHRWRRNLGFRAVSSDDEAAAAAPRVGVVGDDGAAL